MTAPPRPTVVAEVGCNHRGELSTALELIDVAAGFAEVDVVKFQKRDPRTLLSEQEYAAPHPDARHAYGPTYGAHREHLELSVDEHRALAERCAERGVTYSTSVWDVPSARDIIPLAPSMLKVPSACNTDDALLDELATAYGGQIHVSLGMTTRAEEERIVARLVAHGRARDAVLYACTSAYPVAFDELCLHEVTRLRAAYGDVVAAIGFSGHHLGIAADVAALALGATWFERHVTLDRTWKGTDHAASLEPDGLRRLRRDLVHVAEALTDKPQQVLPVEKPHRDKLKRVDVRPLPG